MRSLIRIVFLFSVWYYGFRLSERKVIVSTAKLNIFFVLSMRINWTVYRSEQFFKTLELQCGSFIFIGNSLLESSLIHSFNDTLIHGK